MLKHIEDNEYRNDWNIRQLNTLAAECSALVSFIIPNRLGWFRAGAPPWKPKQTDYDPYDDVYICPNCDEEYEMVSELRKHMKEQECSHNYPSVLRCPWCPGFGFERLSELFKHLESRDCRRDRRDLLVEDLEESLRRRFEDVRVQRRLNTNFAGIPPDRLRPEGLFVRRRISDNDKPRW